MRKRHEQSAIQSATFARNEFNRPCNSHVSQILAAGSKSLGLGLAFFNQSQYQKAIAYYQQALPIFREFKDNLLEGTTLDNLGITYGNLGEHETAIAHYQQALERLRETSDREETSLFPDR